MASWMEACARGNRSSGHLAIMRGRTLVSEPVDGPRLLMDRHCTRANQRLMYALQAFRLSTAQVPATLIK